MIAIVICDKDKEEYTAIHKDCKVRIAQCSSEEMQLSCIPNDAALQRAAQAEDPIHLLYYRFESSSQTEGLRLVRRQYDGAMVLLIAEAADSPLSYLRPGIAPDALLLRPIQESQLKMVNREFVESYFEKTTEKTARNSFLVDTREERTLVPYSHIYYFEAREKKLFLRTRYTEYAFYGTIDSLEKQLPAPFRRCHRSYIVNFDKIVRLIPSENTLELGDQTMVPVSRSYRNILKEMRT